MENTLPDSLSDPNKSDIKQMFLEKYWISSTEKRINRKQFILRWLLISIVGWIGSTLLSVILPSISMEESMTLAFGGKITSVWFAINAILGLVIYYPFYRMNKTLYIKRYADFNNNGKSPRILLPISYYGLVLLTLGGVIIAYTGSPNSDALSTLGDSVLLPIVIILGFSSQLFLAAMICIFLMFIIALFTSGTKEVNNYGSVPTGTPII